MLSWKKDRADISDAMPTFHVRYVGATETFIPSGEGCTTQPLQRLWDNSPNEKHLRKVSLRFSVHGICMSDQDSKSSNDHSITYFNMEDISYCAADKNVNDRLFCWISKNSVSGKLEAHAVLCNTREKAQEMASALSRAFQLAYKDWIAERERERRRKTTDSLAFSDADSVSTSSGSLPSPNCDLLSPSRRISAERVGTNSNRGEHSKTVEDSEQGKKQD